MVDRRDIVAIEAAIKAPCRLATTAAITLSGEQTIDGVAAVAGDRVLVKDQSSGSENGIYTVSTGVWTRARDFDGAYDAINGSRIFVTAGTQNGAKEWYVSTTGEITIGTTSIAFTLAPWFMTGIESLVDDTTPQLGGQLDINGNAIGDGTLELLKFSETASAVNEITIANAATGNAPTLSATGDDDNIDLVLAGKGSGVPKIGSNAILDAGDVGVSVAALGTEDQVLAGGARVTSKDLGTPTAASTVTLDPGDRPLQHLTNNAAFTLAPGANTGSILLDITNGASAGAITISGWTKVVGAFTTTDAHKFRCSATIGSAGSLLSIQAMQ